MTAVQRRASEAEFEDDDDVAELEPTGRRSRRRRVSGVSLPRWLGADHAAPIWIGLVVCAVGFLLILLAWGQVAGETQVYLQLPYLVSAGLTGLALIMVGLTIVNVSTKRRDAAERARQIDQLISILEEVRGELPGRGTR
jgi:hypothetical protein